MTQLENKFKKFKEGNWVEIEKYNDFRRYKELTKGGARRYNLNYFYGLKVPKVVEREEVKFYYEMKRKGFEHRIKDCKNEGRRQDIPKYRDSLKTYKKLLKNLEKEEELEREERKAS